MLIQDQLHAPMRLSAPDELEPFRLAPIASTNVPQFQLHGVQPTDGIEVGKGLLNISKAVIRLDKSVTSAFSSATYSNDTKTGDPAQQIGSVSARLPTTKSSQKPNIKQQRAKTSHPRVPLAAFTFVSVTTTNGKRDWAAETQIRSHAAKRVQARKHQEHGRQEKAVRLPSQPESQTITEPASIVDKISSEAVERDSRFAFDQPQPFETQADDDAVKIHRCGSESKVFAHLRCGECNGPVAVFHEYDGVVDVHYVSGTTLSNSWGQAVFDPFGQMAAPITHRMHDLLSYWVFDHSPQVVPRIYGKNNISKLGVEHELKDAMEDDVACHAISAAAGFKQAAAILKGDSSVDSAAVTRSRLRHEESLSHLQQAMQKLNLRFKDHRQTLTPSTIANVARLAIAAAFAGDTKAHKAHHEGFVKLIEMRGGIDTIPRFKAHHLSRIESNGAWTDKVTPRLPMYQSKARLANPCIGSPFSNRELQDFLWEPLFVAAMDLANMSFLIDERQASTANNPLTREKSEWNEDTFAATQHKIVSFPHPEQQMVKSIMYYRQHCWRCAAFIYFNCVLRVTPAGGIITFAVERLIESLQNSEPWTGWAPHTNILLWVLFMGVIGASSDSEKGLFQLELRRILRQLNLSTAEEVRDVLRMQVWREAPLFERLKGLV